MAARKVVVMPAPRSPALVEITGPSKPTPPLLRAPPKLKELVAKNGEGLLCGTLWLFGESDRQAQRERALRERLEATKDTAAWLPLRRADGTTWTLVGESPGGQGWLVWDDLQRSLRFFAASGTWPEVGADLPEVIAFLGRAGVLEALLPVLGKWADELTRRVTPTTYAPSATRPGEAFAAALARGVDAQPAFADLVDTLPWPDGLSVAQEVLREQPSTEWAEQLDRIVGRSPLCQALRSALATPLPDELAKLRAMGFTGQGTVADETLAATRSPLPGDQPMRSADFLAARLTRRPWPPVLQARLLALSPLEVLAEERSAQTFAKLWPLEVTLGDSRALLPLADEDYVACLDAWLAGPIDLEQAVNVARVRVKSARVGEPVLQAWCAQAQQSLGPGWDAQLGTWALLTTQSRAPGVLELFQDLVGRETQFDSPSAALAMRAAEEHGKSPASLELLRRIYARPRVFEASERFAAARLAGSWGDEQGQEAARAIGAARDRKAHRM